MRGARALAERAQLECDVQQRKHNHNAEEDLHSEISSCVTSADGDILGKHRIKHQKRS